MAVGVHEEAAPFGAEASVMLIIALLVAGTFMLAGSFSIIAVLAD